MTRIDLTNGYYIEADPMCFTLKRTYMGKQKGVEVEKESVNGYYGTIGQAIEKFIYLNKLDKLGDTAVSLREYVERVEEADKSAVRAIQRAFRALGGNK